MQSKVITVQVSSTPFRYSPSLVLDKPNVSKLRMAAYTLEAFRVPTLAHGTDDSSNDELT